VSRSNCASTKGKCKDRSATEVTPDRMFAKTPSANALSSSESVRLVIETPSARSIRNLSASDPTPDALKDWEKLMVDVPAASRRNTVGSLAESERSPSTASLKWIGAAVARGLADQGVEALLERARQMTE